MHGPGWADTLLIWTYDEHGGYYDHVAPPAAVPPDDVPGRSRVAHPSLLRSLLKVLFPGYVRHAEQLVAGPDAYDTYGFRVPAVIVSPYARPDCVLSDVFDHTSVLKLIEEKWNLPALTRRDAAATAPLGALDLAAPPAFLTPPRAARAGAGLGHLVGRRTTACDRSACRSAGGCLTFPGERAQVSVGASERPLEVLRRA